MSDYGIFKIEPPEEVVQLIHDSWGVDKQTAVMASIVIEITQTHLTDRVALRTLMMAACAVIESEPTVLDDPLAMNDLRVLNAVVMEKGHNLLRDPAEG
jgi:hypothetical protein